ncbi:PREDICTED: alveolar macrophage chemotactic factor 2-like [Miniopterus natalensis]|uniref:alveolar macrophage chemotactic factor 2-like n=1 Tax=Miniopterus natalensis TaxID=291302 RepID=UPI0007A72529|nr:PREDICTED: alveolar macrophage chemotactic factor 2-like [Miniopterus natalensis]
MAMVTPVITKVDGSRGLSGELRCVCLTLMPKVHPKMISSLEMVPSGPQCPRVELIATLKNGKQVCLDTEAPLIKKIIQKMLDSGKQKN